MPSAPRNAAASPASVTPPSLLAPSIMTAPPAKPTTAPAVSSPEGRCGGWGRQRLAPPALQVSHTAHAPAARMIGCDVTQSRLCVSEVWSMDQTQAPKWIARNDPLTATNSPVFGATYRERRERPLRRAWNTAGGSWRILRGGESRANTRGRRRAPEQRTPSPTAATTRGGREVLPETARIRRLHARSPRHLAPATARVPAAELRTGGRHAQESNQQRHPGVGGGAQVPGACHCMGEAPQVELTRCTRRPLLLERFHALPQLVNARG